MGQQNAAAKNTKSGRSLKPSDYVHLHNHTQYSLLDGLTKIPQLIELVKDQGMEALAITDHGTMSGTIEFYKSAKANDIKPIIGMEAYIAARGHKDRDPTKDRPYFHLTMLAINNVGYENLMRLSTIANLDGFYYKPRIDHDLLKQYNEGLIVLSGCMSGEVSDALRQGQYQQAKEIAVWYKGIFKDRYFIEVLDHGHPEHPSVWDEQTRVNEQLLQIAKELDIEAVVTCDAHYLQHSDQEAHEILLCVQTGAFLSDEQRMSLKEFELHVADPKDVIKRWGADYPELIKNTSAIADMADIKIELGKILIPKFPVEGGETEKSTLQKNVWQGLAWRYGGVAKNKSLDLSVDEAKKTLDKGIAERAEFELQTIDRMGFNGYFLIVADFINWGKDKNIVFGPGRGSAAGSIVAYAIRITELDPLAYDLIFERFLNPDRISMPDIDIDIQDSRRDEVINYCISKYGKDRVANIVTFGRMAARNSVRDVSRVLQVPYAEADRLAKMIPPPVQGRHIPLATSLKENNDLKSENASSQQSARIFDLAIKLEGTIRSHGVHAAGVVIAPDEIVKFVPLEMAQKGVIATQYSMGPIEDLGLLKMDFLGLSNLTIIKNALRIIKKVYGKNINIDELSLDDKQTYDLLCRGETTGIFQFESSGMRRYLKQLQPDTFEDIIAMGALYRPGPLSAGLTDKYILRKNGREKVSYDHELMKNALQTTYGVIVYQEQVMQIVRDMCGFSGGESDTLRKAVGKKQRDMMAKMKDKVVKGAIANNVDRKIAEKFWKDLEGFADYAFNKSHSACYGLITYQTAWLKAHYPAAFMAALMTSDYDNTDRLAIEINECKHLGIKVLPPDVNESFHEFAVVPGQNQIRFGLDAVKNVGHGAVEEIIRARSELEGGFSKIEDFCSNVNPQIVNRKSMESLIKSGALDRFGERSLLVHNIDNILAFSNRIQKDAASGQVGLFGGGSGESADMSASVSWERGNAEHTAAEQLSWERDLLGIYLSRHPLEQHQEVLKSQTLELGAITPDMDGRQVIIGGSVDQMKEITTKNGAKMAFIRLADMSGEIELIVFPKLYAKNQIIWSKDSVIIVKGKLSSGRGKNTGGDLSLLADEALDIDSSGQMKMYAAESPSQPAAVARPPVEVVDRREKLYIRLEDSSDKDILLALKEKLDSYGGNTEVILVTGAERGKQAIKLPQTIDINEESLRALASVFGATNVVVK
jgi:DNA polymerase-3 subunit alpha